MGLARAKAFQAQVQALGQTPTALVNAVTVLAERGAKFMPDILVTGGSGGGGSIDGLAASLMKYLGGGSGASQGGSVVAPIETPTDVGAMMSDITPPQPAPEAKPQPKPEPVPETKPADAPEQQADAGPKGQQGPKKA